MKERGQGVLFHPDYLCRIFISLEFNSVQGIGHDGYSNREKHIGKNVLNNGYSDKVKTAGMTYNQ